MLKINDLVKIVSIDEADLERFINFGQGGRVVAVCDEGVTINWEVINNVAPENDACDGYFLYFNQVKKVSG